MSTVLVHNKVDPQSSKVPWDHHDWAKGEQITPRQTLERVADHIDYLEATMIREKRQALSEIQESHAENKELIEQLEETKKEIERLSKIVLGLEVQVEERDDALVKFRSQVLELEKQLRKVNEEVIEARNAAAEVERDLKQVQQKYEMTLKDIERLQTMVTTSETKLEVKERALALELSKTEELEKRCRKLVRTLNEAQDKNLVLDQKIMEMEMKLVEEKKRFSERLVQESSSEVRSFRNRIEAGLMSDFRDLQKVKSTPMTPELGDHMRDILRGIFAKLRPMGIDFHR